VRASGQRSPRPNSWPPWPPCLLVGRAPSPLSYLLEPCPLVPCHGPHEPPNPAQANARQRPAASRWHRSGRPRGARPRAVKRRRNRERGSAIPPKAPRPAVAARASLTARVAITPAAPAQGSGDRFQVLVGGDADDQPEPAVAEVVPEGRASACADAPLCAPSATPRARA